MDNQHRQTIGYKEMDQKTIDLFNNITLLGAQIKLLCVEVEDFNKKEQEGEEIAPLEGEPNPARWLALAKTDFQVALMKLKRALTKPSTF